MGVRAWMVGGALAVASLSRRAGQAEASHSAENPKKHKVFFHLTESDPQRANAVLTNVQNFVDVVGWKNIEALELVVHGPGLRPFVAKGIDPEVKAKVEMLLTGACAWAPVRSRCGARASSRRS